MEETETNVAEADKARGEREDALSRKEKRKALKKAKRTLLRRQAAEASKKEEEEEKQVDPEEQQELETMEKKKHDEEEKAWLEREEQARKDAALRLEKAEEKAQQAAENGGTYLVEDNIVWIGNSITIKKATARVEAKDRPTSNPPPPPQLAKGELSNVYESFDQDPTFGTEQDKNFCSFHYKTGACRFSNTCRRAHVYPQKSCTLLMKHMYTGPGLAWEHDEALEYTDKEVEQHYEEFYEDVHSEFLKFGELVNFKVARNGAAHLRGNVYVHYKHEECAVAARNAFLGRYFGGRQVMPEFVRVKKWKQALCGVYTRNLQGCSHGVNCNFLHCFRNPGGDYEWADWDSPAPRSWQKKMATLFGYPYEEPEDTRKSDQEEDRRRSRCRSQDSSGRSKHERERSRSRDDRRNREWDEDSGRHGSKSSRRDNGDGGSRSRDDRRNRDRDEYTGRHRDRSSRRDDSDDRRSSRHQDAELKEKDGGSRKHRRKHEDDHDGDRKRSSSKREGRRSSPLKRHLDERSYDEYRENSRSRSTHDEYERWQGS